MSLKNALGKRKRPEQESDGASDIRSQPDPEDTSKLLAVLQMINESALHQPLKSSAWSYTSLGNALEANPTASFDVLRQVLDAVRQAMLASLPALQPDVPAPVTDRRRTTDEETELDIIYSQRVAINAANKEKEEQIRTWFLQAQALLDELQYGQFAGKRGTLPALPADDSLSTLVSLHRLVGGTQDVYSSAALLEMTEEDIALLRQLKDTDAIQTDLRSYHIANRAPSFLGDANLRPRPLDPRFPHSSHHFGPSNAKTTKFLSYDAYSSFAPTHDSSGAQFGYYDSLDLLAAGRKVAENDRQSLEALLEEAPAEDYPQAEHTSSAPLKLDGSAVAEALGLAADQLAAVYDRLPSDSSHLAVLLKENAEKLQRLQILQWERLRNAVSSKKEAGQLEVVAEEVSEEECAAAASVLKSLTDVLATVGPAAPTSLLASSASLKEALRAPQFLPSEPQPISHQGTLDPNNVTVLREEVLTKIGYQPPPVHAAASRGRGKAKPRGGGRLTASSYERDYTWH